MRIVDYSLLNILAGPQGASGDIYSGDMLQFSRVQSSDCNVEIARSVTSSLGTKNIGENILEYPRINFSVGYLGTNGRNENNAGLVTDGLHGAFININAERCLFASINKDDNKEDSTMAIGNCVLETYSVEAAVGDVLKGNMTFVGWNVNIDEGLSGINPTIDTNGNQGSGKYVIPPFDSFTSERKEGWIRDVSAIGPGQIKISFPSGSAFGMILNGNDKSYEQSFNLSVNFQRDEINKIGARYPTRRTVITPVSLELQTEFLLSRNKADQLRKYYCDNEYDIDITILSEKCSEIDSVWNEVDNIERLTYSLRGMKMKSFSTRDAINNNKTVSISWDVNITNFQNHNKNLFISGSFGQYRYSPTWFRNINTSNSGVEEIGLKPAIKEVFYKQINMENSYPNFDLEMTGRFDINTLDEQLIYLEYRGANEIQNKSGELGLTINKEFLPYKTPDGFSKIVYGKYNPSGSTYKFSYLDADYNVGFGDSIDEYSGINHFFLKGNGYNNQKVYTNIYNPNPNDIKIWIDSGVLEMHPYEPFFFDRIAINILNPEFPTGQEIPFDIIVNSARNNKKYSFVAKSPNKKPFILSSRYQRMSNFWIDSYNDSGISLNEQEIVSIQDHSIKGKTLNANERIIHEQNIFNGKSSYKFDGNSWLDYKNPFNDNLSSFTLSMIYKNSGSVNDNLKLFEFGGDGGSISIFGIGDENLYYSSPMEVGVIYSGLDENINILTLYKNNSGIFYRLNGEEMFSGALSQDIVSGFNSIVVGSGFNGYISEIYMTPFFFGSDFMEYVESYLAKKWIG